jgi:hypothetical protein
MENVILKQKYKKIEIMKEKKQLFEIEGYRIWAYSKEEAYEHLQMIKKI